MFGKSSLALANLLPEGKDSLIRLLNFKTPEYGEDSLNPSKLEAKIQGAGGKAFGLSKFSDPLNTEPVYDLSDSEIKENVWALWFVIVNEVSLKDPKVLREQLSYDTYKSPFKFLPKEQKEDILELMEGEAKTVEMVHVPVIFDYSQNKLWVDSSSKIILGDINGFLSSVDIPIKGMVLDFDNPNWVSEVFVKISEGGRFINEFLERTEDVHKAGSPKMVEPHDNPVIEKILKKHYRCLEDDGYLIFLSSPSKIHYNSNSFSVGINNPHDGSNLLSNSDFGVCGSRIIISEGDENHIQDIMGIDLTENLHTEGYVVLKGLECLDLRDAIKEFSHANNSLTIRDYWSVNFDCTNAALARFISIVNNLLGTNGGLKVLGEN